MNVPTFASVQHVQDDGYLTSRMQMYNDQLNQVLQNALSDNGWTVPNLTTLQISGPYPDQPTLPNGVQEIMPLGTIWFDSTIGKLYVKTAAGTVEQIQSV